MRLSHYLEVLDGLRNKNVWQACSIHNQHRVIITVSRLSLGKDMCYLLYLFNLVAESPNNRGLNHLSWLKRGRSCCIILLMMSSEPIQLI